jgi:6-phosphogluconolactonase (cycloisomerase 2 family)
VCTGLDGAIAVALSPDDKYVYVASTRDDALVVFSRDTTTGQLTFLEFH